jgi:hypothetical protein
MQAYLNIWIIILQICGNICLYIYIISSWQLKYEISTYATYSQLNAPWLHINVITISLNKKNKNITRKKKINFVRGMYQDILIGNLDFNV